MLDPSTSALASPPALSPSEGGRRAMIGLLWFGSLATLAYWVIWFGVDRSWLATARYARVLRVRERVSARRRVDGRDGRARSRCPAAAPGVRAPLDASGWERGALPRRDGRSVRPGKRHLPRLGVGGRGRERGGRALHQRRLLGGRHRDHRLRLAPPGLLPVSERRDGAGATISSRCASPSSTRRPGRSAARAEARRRAERRDPDGPPAEYVEGDLDGDFFQTPYGLFALGAQAMRAGHQVKVINLSAFAWTPRRRGAARARRRPLRHVVLDGEPPRRGARRAGDQAAPPAAHTSSSAGRTRRRSRARCSRTTPTIDTVCIGESELTFLELARPPRSAARGCRGSPGTAYRDGRARRGRARARRHRGPRRPRVAARLLRHAHRDDLARLPVALHLLRRRDELGPRLPRAVGAVRARRAREGASRARR